MATWSLDQCWFRFASLEFLSEKGGKTKDIEPSGVIPDKDGMVKGKTIDGVPFKAKVVGKSLCRQLMEQEEEKKRKEKKRKRGRGSNTKGKKRRTL